MRGLTVGQKYGHRLVVASLLASVAFFAYANRVVLNVLVIPLAAERRWSELDKGRVLAGFFYGYVATQIPGGWLSAKYGPKRVLTASVLAGTVTTFALALFASQPTSFLVLRFLFGLSQGVMFPAVHATTAAWMPLQERARCSGGINTGMHLGSLFGNGIGSVLLRAGFPWWLIVLGLTTFSLLWIPLWLTNFTDSPRRNQYVSSSELAIIYGKDSMDSLVDAGADEEHGLQKDVEDVGRVADVEAVQAAALLEDAAAVARPVEGRSTRGSLRFALQFFRIPACWALFSASFATGFTYYLAITYLPTFYAAVLGLPADRQGFFQLMPYAAMGAASFAAGACSDWLVRRGMAVRAVRVFMQLVGNLGPSIFLLLAVFVPGHAPHTTVALMTLGLALESFTVAGMTVNHLDVAPRSTDVLVGFSNTFNSLGAVVSIPAAAWILHVSSSWPLVFLTCAAVSVAGGTVFARYASTEPVVDRIHNL